MKVRPLRLTGALDAPPVFDYGCRVPPLVEIARDISGFCHQFPLDVTCPGTENWSPVH
jgi:hypothetical protein